MVSYGPYLNYTNVGAVLNLMPAEAMSMAGINPAKKKRPKGFENLPRNWNDDHIVFCARCGRAQTMLQVRLNKINGGQYSLCCDDNLVRKRLLSPSPPKRGGFSV